MDQTNECMRVIIPRHNNHEKKVLFLGLFEKRDEENVFK